MIELITIGGIMCLVGCWFLREPKRRKHIDLDSYQLAQWIARKGRKS